MKNIFHALKSNILKFIFCIVFILPVMNIIPFSFILGITGLISKNNLFEIQSLVYILICLIISYVITIFVTLIINKIAILKKQNITLHILTSTALYVVMAFILGYNAYSGDLLSDLINGKDLGNSIFEMIIYLYFMCLNIFIMFNYGFISLINKINTMRKKIN